MILFAPSVQAQSVQQQVREFRKANEHRLVNEYLNLLSIPNSLLITVTFVKSALTWDDETARLEPGCWSDESHDPTPSLRMEDPGDTEM